MNNDRPLSPKVSDQKVPLLLTLLRRQCLRSFTFLFAFGLPPQHSATCEYFGVVAHVRGGEGFSCNAGDPITELILKRRDEAALFAV